MNIGRSLAKLHHQHKYLLFKIYRNRCTSSNKKMADSIRNVSMVKPVIGVAQMNCTPDIEANFNMALALVEKAHRRGAQMIFLPECFDHICESRADTLAVSETVEGEIICKYKELAQRLGVWLSLGGMHEKPLNAGQGNRLFNTHLVIGADGEIRGRYSKTHLFDVDIKGGVRLRETDMTIPGRSIGPPVETPVGNLGLAVCYDLRFPELSLSLAQQGANILTYPSAFTVPTGMAHWEVLLRSRAIETQCYVVAAAQVGKHHAKRSSYGHTMVVDPWGCVIAECSDQVDVCLAEIDMDYVHKRHLEMPVWSHRRHDLYGHIQCNTIDSLDHPAVHKFGQHSLPSSHVFYKTALSMAFVNRKPVLPGHMLVSPIRVVERFADMTPGEVADLFCVVQRVSGIIEKRSGGSSLTVALQDGPEAGQSVKHVHVHILPRKEGDFKKNDDIYEALEHHDKDVKDSEWRSDENMAAEAAELRQLFQ